MMDLTKAPLILAIKMDKNVLAIRVPVIKAISKVKIEKNLGLPILNNV